MNVFNLGVFVGFVLTLSSYGFLACLLTFFITSSRATKFRSKTKKQLESDFKEGIISRNYLCRKLCTNLKCFKADKETGYRYYAMEAWLLN